MEGIDYYQNYLSTVLPVRKTAGQKAEARQWIMRELKRSGWKAHEEAYGKFNGSVNIIAGDPEKAEVFICTHYDTGSRMVFPNFVSPTNVAAHVLYHALAAVLLFVTALVLSFAVCFPVNKPQWMLPIFIVLALAGLGFMAFGPANRVNANGGDSGVLALLTLAREAAHDKRVCLVLFDNNERNLLGASAFKKKHINAAAARIFIDLDCVGDGENLLLLPSKHSRWDGALLDALEEAFPSGEEVRPILHTKGLHYYPSDNRRFKFHVAVCACRYMAGLGYYIPHLRTKRDTVLRTENIVYTARSLTRFLPLHLEEKRDEN
ncbi:MAG: Zn-dependent exopeptidase M28 [Oscillospiraceae bacterium]|nr:Zn-dependent exopeptidase M28 [Oscillospiraceae bacterium]